jgi:hypothetical protein
MKEFANMQHQRQRAILLLSVASLLPAACLAAAGEGEKPLPLGPISLKLLDEQDVLPGAWYPLAFFARGGGILLNADGTKLCSRDGGKTWSPATVDVGPVVECPDGSIISVTGATRLRERPGGDEPLPCQFRVRRAASFQALLDGQTQDETADVSIPGLDEVYGDDNQRHTALVDHGLVRMPNGDLVVTMYGVFKADRTPVPYFVKEFRQYRSWACISKDGGHTWSFLSTIASVNEHPLPKLAEGYCEPDLAVVGDTKLLCVMRTGGSPGEQPKRYTPLAACVSDDGGATWGAPQTVYRWGVFPRLLRMSHGPVVCLTGRPGFFLLTTGDAGATWSKPEFIQEADGPWGKAPSGYGSIGEVEPGVLGVIYDIYENNRRVVKMRRYAVEAGTRQ